LPAHWEGGVRAKFQNVAAKKFASPSEGVAEEGCGGNSAAPERSAGAKRRRSKFSVRIFAKKVRISFRVWSQLGQNELDAFSVLNLWMR